MLKKILAGALLALSIFGVSAVSEAHCCGDYNRGGYDCCYDGRGCC